MNRYTSPFQPNPKYSYSYQIADDDKQTYITHKEDRDGTDVTGQYRWQPYNKLITVCLATLTI